jgi:outer membrane usher protein
MLPLEVSINTVQVGNWALLEKDGTLYAPAEALEEWRIEKPRVAPLVVRGTNWYPLRSVPGFQARLNPANQSIELVFSPSAFAATRLADEAVERPAVTPAEPALFLNFDTSLSVTRLKNSGTARELGLFPRWDSPASWACSRAAFSAATCWATRPTRAAACCGWKPPSLAISRNRTSRCAWATAPPAPAPGPRRLLRRPPALAQFQPDAGLRHPGPFPSSPDRPAHPARWSCT